jgi:hypothetical protein
MPIPPDDDQRSATPRSIKLPRLDWVFLLIAGIICVSLSGGDLSSIGQQLTGASLTAFKFLVKEQSED